MSQMENLAKHQEDIAKETDRMMAIVNGSESGQKMMESSSAMAGSNEMQSLMQVISSPDVSEQDQFNMGQYMGQFLQANPDEGLVKFGEYLQNIIDNPQYATRADYCAAIKTHALALHESPVYKEYVRLYRAFEVDESEPAQAARQAMQDMQDKIRVWMEDSQDTASV